MKQEKKPKRPNFSDKRTAEAFSRDVQKAVKGKIERTRSGVPREVTLESDLDPGDWYGNGGYGYGFFGLCWPHGPYPWAT